MTDAEILITAIDKAEANGFDLSEVLPDISRVDVSIASLVWISRYAVLFNHRFAKALWGSYDYKPGSYSPRWKHHLQQMVVARKPLKYLAEHIDLVSVRVEA